MSVNPYQSPAAIDDVLVATEEEHLTASRIRAAAILLTLGAFANLACIDWLLLQRPEPLFRAIAAWNVLWLGLVAWAAWRYGPAVCEWTACVLHRVLGGATTREAWLTTYRESLWTFPYAAGLGLTLWLVWLGCFYGLGMPLEHPLNNLFILSGNALGAGVYLPLLAAWLRLRLSA